MKSSPLVSVIIPVRNVADSIHGMLQSLINQDYSNWEAIIVDDASTDSTPEVISKIIKNDPRFSLSVNETRCGVTRSLNRAFALAQGSFIARLDGDDEALPSRFSKQVDFLLSHPEVGVVGSAIICRDQKGTIVGTISLPSSHAELAARIRYTSPLFHPTVMIRKEILHMTNGYDEEFLFAQDLALWLKTVSITQFANILEPLTIYTLPRSTSFRRTIWSFRIRWKYGKEYPFFTRLWTSIRPLASHCASIVGLRKNPLRKIAQQTQAQVALQSDRQK